MSDLLIQLGSNQGDRAAYLAFARRQIEMRIGRLYRASAIYRTAAWGHTDQPDFYNQVLRVVPRLDVSACLAVCQSIEAEAERTRSLHWGPRTLDLDLLAAGQTILQTPELQLPHPRLHERRFVLVPLTEIVPLWRHPILNATARQLLERCPDQLSVTKVDD